jgi:peptidoglycan/xylan/chitin deacetylase (PgdA/CDA1 family)
MSLRMLARAALGNRSQALILAYHRIANLELDPQLLCVSPGHFREHLEVIRRLYEPASLAEVDTVLAESRASARRLILTFDDGYTDNLTAATPLLEAWDVPATVFVVTGHVGDDRFFYWDILAYLFLTGHRLPDHLALEVAGKHHGWQIEPSIAHEWPAVNAWTVLSTTDPLQRCTAYKEVTALMKNQSPGIRTRLLEYLIEWAGMSVADMHPHYDRLSEDGLSSLARHPLIELGSHTVSHPTMALLSREEQEREIVDSKHALEEIVGRPVSSFSYPYGSRRDFNNVTVELARLAGFEVSCANFEATTGRNTDRHILPRFLVRNWDGDEFQRRLAGWFEKY